jgi:hypothetical protein
MLNSNESVNDLTAFYQQRMNRCIYPVDLDTKIAKNLVR